MTAGLFHEEWFGPASYRALQHCVTETEGLDGRVVEIGCWEGRSTIALAEAIAPEFVHAVDTWRGSPGEVSEQLAAERDVYATFTANITALTQGNVLAYREDWRDYFARETAPIRFLHIDATHSYDEVRANLEAALPFMVPGGYVVGDDAHHDPVYDAARDMLGDVDLIATLWTWRVPSG